MANLSTRAARTGLLTKRQMFFVVQLDHTKSILFQAVSRNRYPAFFNFLHVHHRIQQKVASLTSDVRSCARQVTEKM